MNLQLGSFVAQQLSVGTIQISSCRTCDTNKMYTIQKGARGTCHIGLHFLAMPSKIKIQYSIDDTHWALRLYLYTHIHIIEGSLEVKLPTIWTDEKQSRAEAERRGRLEEIRSEEKE